MVGNNAWVKFVTEKIERDYPNLTVYGYKLTSADTIDYTVLLGQQKMMKHGGGRIFNINTTGHQVFVEKKRLKPFKKYIKCLAMKSVQVMF